jgi:hypothetical protein
VGLSRSPLRELAAEGKAETEKESGPIPHRTAATTQALDYLLYCLTRYDVLVPYTVALIVAQT